MIDVVPRIHLFSQEILDRAQSVLHFYVMDTAILKRDFDQVRALVRSGFDIDAEIGLHVTPLIYATTIDDSKMIRLLVEELGASLETPSRFTALHNSCHFGVLSSIKTLCELGANVHAVGYLGRTPIMYCRKDDPTLELLRFGASTHGVKHTAVVKQWNRGKHPLQKRRAALERSVAHKVEEPALVRLAGEFIHLTPYMANRSLTQ
jgi:hypothetical protein